MSTHSHTSDPLHTHQSLQYLPQALHTHLKPRKPISGSRHSTKALHNNIRPSIHILGPYTIPWPFTPTLGPPHQSQALLTHPRPPILIPNPPYYTRPSRSVLEPFHTHPNPFTPTQCSPYPPKPSIPISGPPHPPKAI